MTIALVVLVYLAQLISTIVVTFKYINKSKRIMADEKDGKRRAKFWLNMIQWGTIWLAILFTAMFVNHSIMN